MATSVPNAPVRRLDRNDKALLSASQWHASNTSDLKLEDKVSLTDSKAVFLQGLVVYVGKVHFDDDIYVGVQLTGPSIGRGFCDGTYKGKKYFASVGKNNGVLAPIDKVNKRLASSTGDPEADALVSRRQSEESRMADLEFVDCLVESRALAILKLDDEKKSKGFNRLRKENTHVTRLKELRYEELMRARGVAVPKKGDDVALVKNKYAGPTATLSPHDLELAEGLELTQQNYCLSDPSLPDNPIVYCSQPFLNMCGYDLNEILGKNCRFLQGPDTDKYHVYRVRKSIVEGADCHVCLKNYRKDGSPFYNRLFMTSLRDTKGRIKNYLGVQTEVSEQVALRINAEEKVKFESGSRHARITSTFEEVSDSGSVAGLMDNDHRPSPRRVPPGRGHSSSRGIVSRSSSMDSTDSFHQFSKMSITDGPPRIPPSIGVEGRSSHTSRSGGTTMPSMHQVVNTDAMNETKIRRASSNSDGYTTDDVMTQSSNEGSQLSQQDYAAQLEEAYLRATSGRY